MNICHDSEKLKKTLICVIFLVDLMLEAGWQLAVLAGRVSWEKSAEAAVMLSWYFVPQVQQRSPAFPGLHQPGSAQVWVTVWLRALQLPPDWESHLSLNSGDRIFFHAFLAV